MLLAHLHHLKVVLFFFLNKEKVELVHSFGSWKSRISRPISLAFGKGPFGYMTSWWYVGSYADRRDGETGSHGNYLLSAKLVKVNSEVTDT